LQVADENASHWHGFCLFTRMRTTRKVFQPRRVLLVDDNVDHVATLDLLLKVMGHETEVAISGDAAISIARRFRPDVVLLDWGLPDLEGILVCRQLRQELGVGHVRILMVTGSAREGDSERALEAGCDQFLQKPLDPRFLESLLGSADAQDRIGT
jgi:DNA-binding response OmpR family regulator